MARQEPRESGGVAGQIVPLQPNESYTPLAPGQMRGTLTPIDESETFEALPENLSTLQRAGRRFLGTDVDDPLAGTRMTTIALGGALGAQAGSKIPYTNPLVNPATGALFFGSLGLIAGAVAPEATMELAESLGIMEPGTRDKAGLTPTELRSVAEGELLLDLYTLGGVTALRGLGRSGTRLLTGIDKAGRQLAELSAQQRIALLPVQIGDGTIARGFVSVMGRFPLIGGPIRRAAQEAEIAIMDSVRGAGERIGPVARWNEVSEDIYKDARTLVDDIGTHFEIQYEDLWRAADEAGVTVVPEATVRRARDLRDLIAKKSTEGFEGEDLGAGQVLDRVSQYLDRRILPMGSEEALKSQRLEAMDGLLSAIDQEIASMEPGQRKFAAELFGDLRRAVQLDVTQNMQGTGSQEIVAQMRALDREFSNTIGQLFETSTAKRFASVRRRGLSGMTADEATRMPVDTLARTVMNLNSPQAMRELARIVEPETFRRVTAGVINDAVEKSLRHDLVANTRQFNPAQFRKILGLDQATGPARETLEFMLKQSESPLSVADLETISTIAERISSVPIPNVSTFIARRGVIGGAGAVVSGLIPGLALAGGGVASGGWLGGLLGIGAFVGGGRLVAHMISNPLSARAIRYVLSEEADRAGRRVAAFQAMRFGLFAMREAGEITMPELERLQEAGADILNQFDQQLETMYPDE